jgi:acetyltransferase-like isoleucine patch superfamily enzyme
VGRDAIIGAGAVVVGHIPEFAIATGIPAKVQKDRRESGVTGAARESGTASRES